jgi:UPF0716 protein FxsA
MDPRILFIILFIGFPLLELYILIEVGSSIGAVTTIFIIVFTGVLGGLLLHQQGMRNMTRMRQSMEKGEIPALAMFESMFVFAAAILLIVPGFITDAIGLFFLITPLRLWLIRKIMGLQRFKPPGDDQQGPPAAGGGRNIIDGEFTRDDD